jgi:N-acetyl sugar amidotransferase
MTLTSKLRWCSSCLTMSTRPRITFNSTGLCNACVWAENKKILDWGARKNELEVLLNKHRLSNGNFDCIVPCSGGKDGSYVAYNLKHKFGMNPLCITITPPLTLELGDQNLRSFIHKGYNHISINPDYEAMRILNKTGFIEMGFPYYGWLIAIHTAVIRMAIAFNVGLIFYGEDGEVEYGGSSETSKMPIYDINYQKKVYLEGGYDKVLDASGLSNNQLHFFRFPDYDELRNQKIELTHWSYFENWNPYRNYLIAKEFCGLKESGDTNAGTFTNFSQNDQALYSLHTYLMYLKFGFGRANQDASIEIRRGAMNRSQAVNLVNLYDNHYPVEHINQYLEYFEMSQSEFDNVLEKWVNKELFYKNDSRWMPNFKVI